MGNATILLTGFEPFAGDELNPSAAIVRHLEGSRIAGHQVHGQVLPCEFGTSLQALWQALDRLQPSLVLCLGQAGGRAEISVERVAINVDDARIADNAGKQPVDEPVVAQGPAAYFSSLPIKAVVAGLRRADIPASVSHTAGTFVCNHVFYGLMHACASRPGVQAGFVHVPWLPEQVVHRPGQASMSLVLQVQAIRQALALCIKYRGRPDLHQTQGSLD
ncbi:MAG: pyroglutamyl-peptidase I [Ideonella sp. MAG2]|nr:MAG: pyroglutamyl-peptidase I [Ideonella sp. MAG2]